VKCARSRDLDARAILSIWLLWNAERGVHINWGNIDMQYGKLLMKDGKTIRVPFYLLKEFKEEPGLTEDQAKMLDEQLDPQRARVREGLAKVGYRLMHRRGKQYWMLPMVPMTLDQIEAWLEKSSGEVH
jgi:hypothetical protein